LIRGRLTVKNPRSSIFIECKRGRNLQSAQNRESIIRSSLLTIRLINHFEDSITSWPLRYISLYLLHVFRDTHRTRIATSGARNAARLLRDHFAQAKTKRSIFLLLHLSCLRPFERFCYASACVRYGCSGCYIRTDVRMKTVLSSFRGVRARNFREISSCVLFDLALYGIHAHIVHIMQDKDKH